MSSNRTRRALDGSIIASVARRAWSGSRFLGAIQSSISRTQSLGSAFVSSLPAAPVSRAVEDSAVTGFARSADTAARASFCYRWLTAEPEPEVIVINLRETYTVGPIIEMIDSSVRLLVPASHRSTVVAVTETVRQSATEAPVRMASLVLGAASLTSLAVTLVVGEPTRGGVIASVALLGLAALGTRVTMTWAELVETRPVKMLIAALEPPEPPEKFEERK